MKRDVCIGRTRGGQNTKIHALVNREGIPVCLSLSAGNCADCDQAIPLLQKFGKIKGSNILGDRAYGAKKIRLYLTEQGAQYTIPPTKNLLHPWKYDRQTYKRRNVIERCFCRLKGGTPKFCVKSNECRNRAEFVWGGSGLTVCRLCLQHNAGGDGCQGRRSRSFNP